MAASELSELRAELWRTRDDLERMKARGTPPSANRSPRLLFDRRHHDPPSAALADLRKTDRSDRRRWGEAHDVVSSKGDDGLDGSSGRGQGIKSGPTSPPTSGDSSLRGSDTGRNRGDRHFSTRGGDDSGDGGGGGGRIHNSSGVARTSSPRSPTSRRKPRSDRDLARPSSGGNSDNNLAAATTAGGPSEEIGAAAEDTLRNLALEGAAFKNWTEEASSIAVRLIEEVKTLRWEKAGWADRERAAENTAAELRSSAGRLEERLRSAEADLRRSQEALARAQQIAERERARATAERAKADALRSEAAQKEAERAGGGGAGLVEMLRREKEGADALQRRLDVARAAAAKHERERKEWRSSRARLEELRRSWGKQLKKVEKKMRLMAKENASLRARVSEAERARDRADADALQHRDALRRLTEQRDNLLLGASRLGGGRDMSASSPAETLAELLAAAAAVAAGGTDGRKANAAAPAAEELESQLEQARSEAKLARVAAQQERLRRDAAAREKDEAVRQLHRLQGAARRAVGRRDSRLRSSRMETEVVWNALTEAVR